MSLAAVRRTTWPRRGHLLMSPALTSLGLVAGFTMRALGSMGGSATPSMLLGTRIPCQWMLVGSGSSFLKITRIRSPWVTRIMGPGIWPL